MNPGSFAALMRQIVGKYPPGFSKHIVSKAMISVLRVFPVFSFQHLRQQNPVLLISIGFPFPFSPFLVTRSICAHNLTEKIYRISNPECIYDFKFFSLPVTDFLAAPTPFTIYPFLISRFQFLISQPLATAVLILRDFY